MDTQETGTTEEKSSTTPDENAIGATSEEHGEDADQLKRIADKEQYLKDLDRQIKEKESVRNKGKPMEDADDVIVWTTAHSDDLKMVSKEYQEELRFYKSHKIPVTNDIRDKALFAAKASKGLLKNSSPDASRQAATSSEATGEMRRSATVSSDVPPSVQKLSKTLTKEQYAKYREEFKARGLKV